MQLPRFVAWFGPTPTDAAVTSAIVAEQLRYLRRHLLAKAPDYPKSLVAEFLGLLAADIQLLAKKCATLPAPHNPSKRVVATAGRAMKVIIIAAVFVLTFATDMMADETTIGRWCDRMVPNLPKHNQTMAIVITDGAKVMLKSEAKDIAQLSFFPPPMRLENGSG